MAYLKDTSKTQNNNNAVLTVWVQFSWLLMYLFSLFRSDNDKPSTCHIPVDWQIHIPLNYIQVYFILICIVLYWGWNLILKKIQGDYRRNIFDHTFSQSWLTWSKYTSSVCVEICIFFNKFKINWTNICFTL